MFDRMLPSTSLPSHDVSSTLSRLLQRKQALPKVDVMETLFPSDPVSITSYFTQVSGLLSFEPFRVRLMRTLVKRVFLAKAFNASEHEYLVFELEGEERRMQVERTTGPQSLKRSEKLAKLILVPIPKSLRKKKPSKRPSSEKNASASRLFGSRATDSRTPSDSEESSDPSLSSTSDSPAAKSSLPSPYTSPASSSSSGTSRVSVWRKISKVLRSTASLASSSSSSSSSSSESTTDSSSSRRLFTGFRPSGPFKRRCASAPATFNNDETRVVDESSASSSSRRSDAAVPSQLSSLSGYAASDEPADHSQTTLSIDGTRDESENSPTSDPTHASAMPLFPEEGARSEMPYGPMEYLVLEEVDARGSLAPTTSLSGSTKLVSVSSSEDATRVDPEPSSEPSLSSSSESKRSLRSIAQTAMKILRTSLLLTGIVSLASMVDTLASDRIIAYIPKEDDKTLDECTVQCMEFEDGHSPPLWKVILACVAAHQLDPFYKLWLHQCYWYVACICYLLQYMVGNGNYRVFGGSVASEGDSDNFSFTPEEKANPKTRRLAGHWGFVPIYDQRQREFTQLEESFNKFVLQFEDSVSKAEEENRCTLEEQRQAGRREVLEKTTKQLAQEYEKRQEAEEKANDERRKADEERKKAEAKELELEEERRKAEAKELELEEERHRTEDERRKTEAKEFELEKERRRTEEERLRVLILEKELEALRCSLNAAQIELQNSRP